MKNVQMQSKNIVGPAPDTITYHGKVYVKTDKHPSFKQAKEKGWQIKTVVVYESKNSPNFTLQNYVFKP